jgi:hypothetical protein
VARTATAGGCARGRRAIAVARPRPGGRQGPRPPGNRGRPACGRPEGRREPAHGPRARSISAQTASAIPGGPSHGTPARRSSGARQREASEGPKVVTIERRRPAASSNRPAAMAASSSRPRVASSANSSSCGLSMGASAVSEDGSSASSSGERSPDRGFHARGKRRSCSTVPACGVASPGAPLPPIRRRSAAGRPPR